MGDGRKMSLSSLSLRTVHSNVRYIFDEALKRKTYEE